MVMRKIMSATSPKNDDHNVTFFQIVVLVLSILILLVLLTDNFVPLPKEASKILQSLDTAVCGLFLIDFGVRFRRAENKLLFMKWGWIDLVASIPNVDLLRWGRTVRILRIIRILRAIRSFQKILALIFRNRLQSGLGAVLTTSSLLIVFASMAILMCENNPEANIKTAEDAVWWSITTITTVGYGDKYPTTTEGRIIAMVLMVAGVGLFGTLSGLVASYFLGHHETHSTELEGLMGQMKILQQKIEQLQPPEKWRQ